MFNSSSAYSHYQVKMVEQEKDRRRHWFQICCEFRCGLQKFLNASEAHLANSTMAADVAFVATAATNRILKRSDGDRCTHNLCCESIRLSVGIVLRAKPSKRIWIGSWTHPALFYYLLIIGTFLQHKLCRCIPLLILFHRSFHHVRSVCTVSLRFAIH